VKPLRKTNCRFLILPALLIILMSLSHYRSAAQSVGISSGAITPDASSILEMRTTTRGLLIPRMTITERDAISSPATGLMVYNTTTSKFNFYNGSSWIAFFSGSSGVNSITGTTNRIAIGGTAADPTIDIAAGYLGQSSITTLGTIGTGVWNSTLINPTFGGTGVNNGSKTITVGGNLITSGAFGTTLTSTATTNVTLPTTGTLATLAGTETFTNKTISGASNTLTNIATTSLTGTLQAAQFPALTGDVTNSAGSLATTIASNAVTNAKLAQIATQTFKGRITAATGNVEDLTVTQATAMLDVFTSTLKGVTPASGGGTSNYLRADGTWTAPNAKPNWAPITKSTSVTLTNAENFVLGDCTSGNVVLTLPASPTNGQEVVIIKSGTNEAASIKVLPNSGQVIGQALTFWTLTERNHTVTFVYFSASTAWRIISRSSFSPLGYRRRGSVSPRYYSSPNTGTALTTAVMVANTLYAMPLVIENAVTIDEMRINVTTAIASSVIRLGIYDDSNNEPEHLVIDCGTQTTATTGVKTYTTGLPISLPPGFYWLVAVSGNNPTIRGFSVAGMIPLLGVDANLGTAQGFGYSVAFTNGALPTSYPSSPTVRTAAPLPAIFVRYSD